MPRFLKISVKIIVCPEVAEQINVACARNRAWRGPNLQTPVVRLRVVWFLHKPRRDVDTAEGLVVNSDSSV